MSVTFSYEQKNVLYQTWLPAVWSICMNRDLCFVAVFVHKLTWLQIRLLLHKLWHDGFNSEGSNRRMSAHSN